MVGLDHVGPQFKPLAQGVDSFVEASSDLPVIADAVVTPSFDASAPRLSPPHTPESPAKRPPWLSPGASGSAAGGLAAKAAQVTLRPERSEGAESTRVQALSARPATTHETREGVLRAKDAEKGTFSDRTRLCRGGSDCDNVSKGGVGTAPQKRPIECCTTELSAPGHETRASQGDMHPVLASALPAEPTDAAPHVKRAALARIPPLRLRWASAPHIAREHDAALAQLLYGRGLHDQAALTAELLRELMPLLPGGGLPRFLSTCLWARLLALDGVGAQHNACAQLGAFASRTRFDGARAAATSKRSLPVATLRAFFSSRLAGLPAEARLFPCLSSDPTASRIVPDDLAPLLEQVLLHHPGLGFLCGWDDFPSRYAQTAIARVFYEIDPLRSGSANARAVRSSALLHALRAIDDGDAAADINAERRYFSYEHFYVIYCTFCKLDEDNDALLSAQDLQRYGDFGISPRMAQRIVACAPRKASARGARIEQPHATGRDAAAEARMDYTDFLWFILSEENKLSHTAVGYWFHMLDIDGDGEICPRDMEYFYEEQMARQESLAQEAVPFSHVLSQLADAVNARRGDRFSLADVRRSMLCPLLVHTLCNVNKFLLGEVADSQALRDAHATPALNDWDRWAMAEYRKLALEDDEDRDCQPVDDDDDDALGERGREDDDAEADDDEDLAVLDNDGYGYLRRFGLVHGECGLRSASGAAESPF